MRTGEGFLAVYAINNRGSYEEIQAFHQQILRVKDKDYFPIVIVANKCDLEYERQVGMNGTFSVTLSYSIMLITFTEGRDLARHCQCKFIETSAKSRINVDEAFWDLVREIRRFNKVTTYLLLCQFSRLLTGSSISGQRCWTPRHSSRWLQWPKLWAWRLWE